MSKSGVEDMVMLTDVSEGGISANLKVCTVARGGEPYEKEKHSKNNATTETVCQQHHLHLHRLSTRLHQSVSQHRGEEARQRARFCVVLCVFMTACC
jgi:hypothetical protein